MTEEENPETVGDVELIAVKVYFPPDSLLLPKELEVLKGSTLAQVIALTGYGFNPNTEIVKANGQEIFLSWGVEAEDRLWILPKV